MCGPATVPITRASTPKWPSASTSWAADLLLAGGVGARRLAGGALEEARVGDAPLEVGRVGDRRAVAALRGEVVGVDRPRSPARVDAGLVGLRDPRPGAARRQARRLVLRLARQRGRLDLAGRGVVVDRRVDARDELAGLVVGVPARPRRAAGGRTAGHARLPHLELGQLLARRAPARARDRGAHLRVRVAQRARRRADGVARRLDHARDRGAREQQRAREQQEERR